MKLFLAVVVAAATMAFAPMVAVADPHEKVTKRVYDERGWLVWEFGEDGRPDIGFARHYTHVSTDKGRPGPSVGTDCTATQYRLGGWHWTAPYSANTTGFATQATAAATAWDAATGAALLGSITPGAAGTAGVRDGINQIAWVNLGASTTIAVTTTWYTISGGVALESDGQYNTYYAWSTSGEANKMDAQNILTHEIGHTFGLDHPQGKPAQIGCLTMYAYANYGEVGKRTLGDGDILGARAIYGA